MADNKTKFPLTIILLSTLLFLVSGTVLYGAGADLKDVAKIVDNTNRVAYYQGTDGKAKVNMTIYDSQGRTRERRLTILRWDQPDPKGTEGDEYCGGQKIYAYFDRPADVNKTVFLVWKNLDKDDDRWMYLPALDLVKRISSTDKRTSFVGSHFYYEDVSGRNINDDTHELTNTTNDYYVLKNTPKNPDMVEFAYFEMWIHKESFTVVKIDYYDRENNKYRVYEVLAVDNIQGYPTVTKSKMTDLKSNGYTILEYSDVRYNIGLTEDIFTERYLKRPPREFLK
ncbi:MAG: outer membrane lipoprotein-sorting protein [Desulfatiglans sp.]|jgi:outer membrane lipoprotein-sorting protein|nr:outer membrane lipoprotein-sorting protein [Desulfatiglans sp.]